MRRALLFCAECRMFACAEQAREVCLAECFHSEFSTPPGKYRTPVRRYMPGATYMVGCRF